MSIFDDVHLIAFKETTNNECSPTSNEDILSLTAEIHSQTDLKKYNSGNNLNAPGLSPQNKSSDVSGFGFSNPSTCSPSKNIVHSENCSCPQCSSVGKDKNIHYKFPATREYGIGTKTPEKKKKSTMNLDQDSGSKKLSNKNKNKPIHISTRKHLIYANFNSLFSEDEIGNCKQCPKVGGLKMINLNNFDMGGNNILGGLIDSDEFENNKLKECNRNLTILLKSQNKPARIDHILGKDKFDAKASLNKYKLSDNLHSKENKYAPPVENVSSSMQQEFDMRLASEPGQKELNCFKKETKLFTFLEVDEVDESAGCRTPNNGNV